MNGVNHSLNSVSMHPGSMQNVEAMSAVILRPNSDLYRLFRNHDPFPCRPQEHGAVVHPFTVGIPSV